MRSTTGKEPTERNPEVPFSERRVQPRNRTLVGADPHNEHVLLSPTHLAEHDDDETRELRHRRT